MFIWALSRKAKDNIDDSIEVELKEMWDQRRSPFFRVISS